MSDFFWEVVVPFVGFAIAAVLIGVSFILPIRYIQHHYDEQGCHAFSRLAEREVKFVDYTYWTWDCLVRAKDGKWVSSKALRDEVDA